MRMLEPLPLLCDGGVFVLHGGEPLVGNESDAVADVRQPLVGVILPMEQTVFAARRHNTVRLFGALGDEIVDERADVAVRTAQDQRPSPRILRAAFTPATNPCTAASS